MTEKLKLDKLFCFMSEDETGEGVCGFKTAEGWMPMVGGDMARVASLMEMAQHISNSTGKPIHLLEFDARKLIKTILPNEDKTDGTISGSNET